MKGIFRKFKIILTYYLNSPFLLSILLLLFVLFLLYELLKKQRHFPYYFRIHVYFTQYADAKYYQNQYNPFQIFHFFMSPAAFYRLLLMATFCVTYPMPAENNQECNDIKCPLWQKHWECKKYPLYPILVYKGKNDKSRLKPIPSHNRVGKQTAYTA